MDSLLTVAFIIAATSFFKERFALADKYALLCSFLVTLVVAFAPLIGAALPATAPWIEATVKVIALFIGAAGSWDTFRAFSTKQG